MHQHQQPEQHPEGKSRGRPPRAAACLGLRGGRGRGRIYEGFGSRGLGGIRKGLRMGSVWDGKAMSGCAQGGTGKGKG